jgi:hypothetical protein
MSHNTIHHRRAGGFANRFSPMAGRLRAHPAICGRGAGNGSRFSYVVFVDFARPA